MDSELEPWDPTIDPRSPQVLGSKHRNALWGIRDKLQRAMISGGMYNVVELDQDDLITAPYVPSEAARHKVIYETSEMVKDTSAKLLALHNQELGASTSCVDEESALLSMDQEEPIKFASNTATSLLLSRQFESIARKDIMLEEAHEFNMITLAMMQTTKWKIQKEANECIRGLAKQVEDYRQEEALHSAMVSQHFLDLENGCRRRIESMADECNSRITQQVSRAFDLLRNGQTSSQKNWIVQQEERGRHGIILEADRVFSKINASLLSEGHRIMVKTLLQDRGSFSGAAAAAAAQAKETDEIISKGEDRTATSAAEDREEERFLMNNFDLIVPGLVPIAAPPLRDVVVDADRSASERTDVLAAEGVEKAMPVARFTPFWGWMCKSTGVLMTWQKRFFVFTQKGRLRYSLAEKGPWTTMFHAQDILRVEVDSYHDSANGAQPPSDKYHQYGFYIDIAEPSEKKPRRIRFCCNSRSEMNNWIAVLRNASDVIYALEDSGALARSPHRSRLTAETIQHLLHSKGESVAPHSITYRKRTQLDDDLAVLQEHQKEKDKEAARAKKNAQLFSTLPLEE